MTEDKQELLEIYKLHAELADRVSQRREGANRLYASLLTGILGFLAISLRFGTGDFPIWGLLVVAGVLGMLLSASWFVIVRSYRQLNSGKFKPLHELESKLAYPFFKREWDLLAEGEKPGIYWKLTTVETGAPIAFFALFLAVLIAGIVIFCK